MRSIEQFIEDIFIEGILYQWTEWKTITSGRIRYAIPVD